MPDSPIQPQRDSAACSGSSSPWVIQCAAAIMISANTRRVRFTIADPTSRPDRVKKIEVKLQQNEVSSPAIWPI